MLKTRQELPLELQTKTFEALEEYLNSGGIEDLAAPLDYLVLKTGEDQIAFNEDGQFKAYWQESEKKRLLVVYSNIGRIAGLSLILPVQPDRYQLAHGQIGASLSPRIEQGNLPRAYSKLGHGIAIGDPNVVVHVQQIAANELWQASGL